MEQLLRNVQTIIEAEPVIEGAGVKLQRSIGGLSLRDLDPFLLFDHFGSQKPEDYQAGFPMHPHRGIETVTYMLTGEVHHRDTLGNAGSIGPGDVQWMTAGGGIMHEEMPQVRPEGNEGFQLWVNLPASRKMTQPRYQNISAEAIPQITTNSGVTIRVIAGNVEGADGPITGIGGNPIYLDVSIPTHSGFTHCLPRGQTAFAYIFKGTVTFANNRSETSTHISHPRLVVLDDGERVTINTDDESARLLLIAAQPLHEPIVRYGPFVMNTKAEIEQALRDLQQGTFIWSEQKHS